MVGDELGLKPGDREAARAIPCLDEEVAFSGFIRAADAAPRLLAALEACEEMLSVAAALRWDYDWHAYEIARECAGWVCRRRGADAGYYTIDRQWDLRHDYELGQRLEWPSLPSLWAALKAAGCTPTEQ